MNVIEFKEKQGLKESTRTIKKWLDKGYILGACKNNETGEWVIPKNSLPPYTKARAKTQSSIRKSIVTGINLNRRVFAELYSIDKAQFDIFINQLLEANIIEISVIGEYTFYNTTLKADEYLRSKNPDSILIEAGLSMFKIGYTKVL